MKTNKIKCIVGIPGTLATCLIIGIALIISIGCGEGEDPLDPMEPASNVTMETLGAAKTPEAAPAAPQMQVPEGTPTVQSVGYYSDWKLTKPLTGTVSAGKTIFIKVVFSEGMKLVVADDKSARPILYRKIAKKLTRFRIAGFGAKGQDFVSGDAKPMRNQATYLCKYVVQPEDKGAFVFAVGKFSVDRQGNTLPAFYTHNEQLQCGPPTKKPQPETPKPTDTIAPTVESITHSYDGNPIAEGESVPAGTTIETQIVFSERVIPTVQYTTGGKTKAYTTSQTVGGVHWRGICKPTDKSGTVWLCKQTATQPSFSVTVTTSTVDTAGNPLAEAVTTPEIPVTKPVVRQPQKPITPITEPEEPTQQPSKFIDLGYTFTLEGERYPGFNPSPGLQKILETHPSAKLPHFEEAVQMVEVMDWVYRRVWTVYPDWETTNKDIEARDAVLAQFGLSQETTIILSSTYFRILDGPLPGHSQYWLIVEYLRLKLEHLKANEDALFNLFNESISKGWIIGIVNPNT